MPPDPPRCLCYIQPVNLTTFKLVATALPDESDIINEADFCIRHAEIIAEYDKEIHDFPSHVCCCCEQLHQRKSITVVSLDSNLGGTVWRALVTYILCTNPSTEDENLYMCSYCKPLVRKDIMPARCVLSGLEVIPIPDELRKLDPLSIQIIQLTKCFQTVVRLGAYTKSLCTTPSRHAKAQCSSCPCQSPRLWHNQQSHCR